MAAPWDVIPLPIRQSAMRLISAQKAVPMSPLRRTADDQVELCAAAALAAAGTPDPSERRRLIDRFEAGGRQSLVDAFERLGWSGELGARILDLNDAFDPSTRRRDVLDLLAHS